LKTEAGASLPYFLIPLYLVVREHGISFQSLPPFRQAIQGRSHQRFSPRSSRQLRWSEVFARGPSASFTTGML